MFVGSSVLGVDAAELRAAGFRRAAAVIACLYTATGAWTVAYEGTYSFQDLTDDLKAGVSALLFFRSNLLTRRTVFGGTGAIGLLVGLTRCSALVIG